VKSEFIVRQYKVRWPWRLRVRLRVLRLRRWWELRRLDPEVRAAVDDIERRVDRAFFFGRGG
jgi:hypothetical protein